MRSLTLKLTLAFLFVSLIGLILAAALTRWATVTEFNQFVMIQARDNFIRDVSGYYELRGSWTGVGQYLSNRHPPPGPGGPGPNNGPNLRFALLDLENRVIIPAGPWHIEDYVPAEELNQATPVEVNGQLVGKVLTIGTAPDRDSNSERFLAQTNRILLVAAVGGAALALSLGVWLARSLTRPLRELTGATRAIAKGNLEQTVLVRSQDELGDLAASFNQMSADLHRATQARRQMTADIAHDLRTPLSIITGYLEAVHNGVLEANPARIEAMYTEARHLQRLVDDLRTLSLADAGELPLNRQRQSPQALLDRAAAAFQHPAGQRNIQLLLNVEPGLPDINVDPERLAQVLGNLISNALRYTAAGGVIRLSAHRAVAGVELSVQDTGVGIAPEVLPRIFDRLYRGDPNRPDSAGESGLGLAIAKSVVEAHRGTIQAESQVGKGATFRINLPAA